MQVAQGRQDLDAVREHLGQRQRSCAARPGRCVPAQLLERPAADVLHHDVPDQSRRCPGRGAAAKSWIFTMFGWSTSTRKRRSATAAAIASGVAGVDQSLEDHPAVGSGAADVAVAGQVDPAEPAVGERAEDLVPVVDQVAGGQPGPERERGAVLGQKPSTRPGWPSRAARPARRTGRRTAATRAPAGRPAPRVAGSRSGTGGTSTRLAPSRPRPPVRLRVDRCGPRAECRPSRREPSGGGRRRPVGRRGRIAEPDAARAGALCPHSSQ